MLSAGSRTPRDWSRTMWPPDSSITRLRIWSTMPASWVAMITVVPVRLIRSRSFMMPTEVFGSRFPVGSSAIRIIGRFTNARAIATRCCSPPESSSGIRVPLPSRPTSSRVSGTTLLMWLRGLPITCRANATFSVTVLFGSRRKSWKTVPIWRRRPGTFQPARRLISLPATYTLPWVGRASAAPAAGRWTCRSPRRRRGRRTPPSPPPGSRRRAPRGSGRRTSWSHSRTESRAWLAGLGDTGFNATRTRRYAAYPTNKRV